MSLVSSTWLEDYLRDMDMDEKVVERSKDDWRFKPGKTAYTSTEKMRFPLRMKTDGGSLIEKDITANL